jgi:hypothetical protein
VTTTIAAIYADRPNTVTKVAKFSAWILEALTLIMVLVAQFKVWKNERTAKENIQEALDTLKSEFQPLLQVDFLGNGFNVVHADHKRGEKVDSLIYVRVRVQNSGTASARGCQVFLTSLKEIYPGGGRTIVLDDSKVLAWEGYSYSPIDIPAGTQKYADVMRVSKNESGWLFSVQHLFAHEEKLKTYRGTYRFEITATAENTVPSLCQIDVSYNGDWHNLRAYKSSTATRSAEN